MKQKKRRILLEGRECSVEEFEEAVDRVINSGDRERIWLLKDTCMQALYYGKHTFPDKMQSMRKCLRKLEKALEKTNSKRGRKNQYR